MVFEKVAQDFWESLYKRFYFRRMITQQINCAKSRIESAQFRQLLFETSVIGTHNISAHTKRIEPWTLLIKHMYAVRRGQYVADAEDF
jgi:hypothetical protein